MKVDTLFQALTGGTYSGRCSVGLENPDGNVRGTATIRVDQNAKNKAEVLIEDFDAPPEYGGSLMGFLNASVPKKRGTGTMIEIAARTDERRIVSLEMQTDEGMFTASSGLLSTPFWIGFEEDRKLSVVFSDLAFTPHDAKSAKYWFVPLQGPFGEHYIGRVTPAHPMALGERNIITFSAAGLSCGLQLFDADEKPIHPMAAYDAIAFGELQGATTTVEETWDAVPRAFLEVLSFAIGADVVVPWIELRAEDGSLVKRFYIHVGRKSSEDGFATFCKVNEFSPNSGIGAFLSVFFALPEAKREALIAPLNLMRSGAPGSFNIEDSITDLVKALDNVCSVHGLTAQDLRARLDPDNETKLESLLTKTRNDLGQTIADNRTAARQGQVDALNVILSRVANVMSHSRDFGIAVKELLRKMDLHDADVLDVHYANLNPPGSWAGLLSAVRGEVVHLGILRIKDRQSLHSWFEFSRHLHDLCKRVILREARYAGMYYASTNPWTNNYAVDRVTLATTVQELGFSQVPTHI
jgi:hypothetical protein